MDAHTLTAWTRFALQKGGIGSCTALVDNPATEAEDLMFMTGENIIVLRRLDDDGTDAERRASTSDAHSWFLGYCEGVVGRFKGAHVQFHGKLKKPVLMRRSGASSSGHGHSSTSLLPSRGSPFPASGLSAPTSLSTSPSASTPIGPPPTASPLPSPSSTDTRPQALAAESSSRTGRMGLDAAASRSRPSPVRTPRSTSASAAGTSQQQGPQPVTAPLAIRRPFKPTTTGALQAQAARRMELTTPPLSDDNHQSLSTDSIPRPRPSRSNTATVIAEKARAPPPADVQAASESFRRRVADALQVDDDADSDDSASVLPWARNGAHAAASDDDDEDGQYGLSRSAPGSTRHGVRTPEHPNAANGGGGGGSSRHFGGSAVPSLPNGSSSAIKTTPVKRYGPANGSSAGAHEQQRTLAQLSTNGLPPSPISSADSPSARSTAAGEGRGPGTLAPMTPTQLGARSQLPFRHQQPPSLPASAAYTIAAQSSAPSSRSSATVESEEDEHGVHGVVGDYDDDERHSESAGSFASASDSLSGSGHGPATGKNGHIGTGAGGGGANKHIPPTGVLAARAANRRGAPTPRGGGGGAGAGGKSGRDYAFSIYDLYGRDSVAFPNFDLHKEANRAMLAKAGLGHMVNLGGEGRGAISEEVGEDGNGMEELNSGGAHGYGRTPAPRMAANRPMHPPPVTTAAMNMTMAQQDQAIRTPHLRQLSQRRPSHAPDPRKGGSISSISTSTTSAPVPAPPSAGPGPVGLSTKSLASNLRRQVEGNAASAPSTAMSSPTLSHAGAYPPSSANGGSGAGAGAGAGGANGGPVPPSPAISFDPHRRPSAPAAVVNGAAVGGPAGVGTGAGAMRPPMPGQGPSTMMMMMGGSFSGPSSAPRPMMMPPPPSVSGSSPVPNGPMPVPGSQEHIDRTSQGVALLSPSLGPLVITNPSAAGDAGMGPPPPHGMRSGPGGAPVPMSNGACTLGPGGGPSHLNLAGAGGPGLAPGMNGGPSRMGGSSSSGYSPQYGGPGSSPGGPGSMLSRTPSPLAPSSAGGPMGGPPHSPGFAPAHMGSSPGYGTVPLPNGMGPPGARGSGAPVRASSDRTPDRESGRGSGLLKKNPSNPNPSGSRGPGMAHTVAQHQHALALPNGAPVPGWGGPAPHGGGAGGGGGPGLSPMRGPGSTGEPSRSPSPYAASVNGAPSMRSVAPSMRSVRGGAPAEPAAAPQPSGPPLDANGQPLVFDATGFVVGSQPSLSAGHPVPEDRDVIDKWDGILRDGDLVAAKKSRKVKKMTQSGIPDSMRAAVWLFLSNSAIRRRPGLFEQLCKQSQDKKARKGKEAVYEQIEKDVRRCYPEHRLFVGEGAPGTRDLEAILKAYAQYNPVVGYMQGMGLIVGLFLMLMPAEDAFWLLCALLRDVHMEGYYTENMKQLHIDGVVFGQLLQSMDPEVHARLSAWGIEPINYVPNWFLPMFSRILPWQTTLRVWDTFFFEGPVWIIRVSLAIIRIIREPLMACKDYDSALTLLLHPPPNNLTPDNVLGSALSVKLKDGEVRKLSRTASKLVRQSNALVERGRSASRVSDRGSISGRSMSMPAKR